MTEAHLNLENNLNTINLEISALLVFPFVFWMEPESLQLSEICCLY